MSSSYQLRILESTPRAMVGPSARTGRVFRSLVAITILALFGLVTLGGVVRATDSGLGCPDWPLCYGGLLPLGQEHNTYIELSHRLVAGAVGLMMASVAILAWRHYRWQRWIYIPALLGFALLVIQGLLGGVTVLKELPRWAVMAHLAMAEGMIAVLLVVYVASRHTGSNIDPPEPDHSLGRFPAMALGTAMAAYALIVIGSYVANTAGATFVCGDSWPLCRGELFPRDELSLAHMGHRAATLAVGFLMALTVGMAWVRRQRQPHLWHMTTMVAVLFLVQVLVGASNMWLDFSAAVRVAHLSLGTGVWMGLALLSILALSARGSSVRGRTT